MTKKHYITISVCALLIVICLAIFGAYYRDYIKPESYSIGVIEQLGYKELTIKDYLSDDDVLFSQNINDVGFDSSSDVSVYEYNFDPITFDGEANDYIIYVNDYMVNNITESAGTISGTYILNYYDVEKKVLCSSAIDINFTFYSLQSKLQVSVNTSDLGYLMNYFKTDNFIITLAKSPFTMNDQDVESTDFVTVNYYIDDELWNTEKVIIGTTITLKDYNNTRFIGWFSEDGQTEYSTFVVKDNINVYAKLYDSKAYRVTFDIRGNKSVKEFYEGQPIVAPNVTDVPGSTFYGWTEDMYYTVNLSRYKLENDVVFYAMFSREISVNQKFVYSPEEMKNTISIDLDEYADLDGSLWSSGNYLRYSIKLKLTMNYQEDGASLSASSPLTLELHNGKFDSYVFGNNGLDVELNNDNVIILNADKQFEPASYATKYTFEIEKIVVYEL